MRHDEIARDLDQAIAKLTDAKAKVSVMACESDLGELRKVAGAVSDFHSWVAKLPEPPAPEPPAPEPPAPEPEQTEPEHEAESEVSGMNAEEAKAAIGRMRSTEKLRHIVANDHRVTVREAAQNRIYELEHKDE